MNNKDRQLGMNYSTARYRLQRMIIFWLAQEAGLERCYRCNEPILSVTDLTIDHKEHWLDNDPALFWDMDNIAFSHRDCNSEAHRVLQGEAIGNSILDEDEVIAIKEGFVYTEWSEREYARRIAKDYGVTASTIRAILRGKSWDWVTINKRG